MSGAMNNIIKDNDKDQFANGQISRDLRANWGGTEPQTRLDAVNVIEQCPDVAREEFSASENWERVRQWRVSRFLPEQIDADERLPGYLREPHLPRFESRNRVMPDPFQRISESDTANTDAFLPSPNAIC
jgi:hypothetical protein